MRQGIANLMIKAIIPVVLLPSLALAIQGTSQDSVINTMPAVNQKLALNQNPIVNQYPGEFNRYYLENWVNHDSEFIKYQGKVLQVAPNYRSLIWNTSIEITSPIPTNRIYIQLRDSKFSDGKLAIEVDGKKLGEFTSGNYPSSYFCISDLETKLHKVIIKNQWGPMQFAWVGFGDKSGDAAPPVTSFISAPALVNGMGNGPTEINFWADDFVDNEMEPSGVERTYYSLNEGPWREVKEPLRLPIGHHTLRYYSIDFNGNIEEVKTTNIIINAAAISNKHEDSGVQY